jgi:hypothetical protein
MQILYGTDQFETPSLMIPDAEWQDIVDLCISKRSIREGRDQKWKTGWLCPAILQDGASSRRNTDVERMAAWIGLDLDHAGWSLAEMHRAIQDYDMPQRRLMHRTTIGGAVPI